MSTSRLDTLAKLLADRSRIGMSPEIADRLKLRSEDALRGQLLSEEEDDRGHFGVYLLGSYVVDDTDLWGDGEIYWWAIPTLVDRAGRAIWSTTTGLPTGAPPHKVGSLEWMTNFSLAEPPLLALIPPFDEIASAVIRLAFYDDDGDLADVPKAIGEGLTMLSGFSREPQPGPDQIILPIREAIFKSLKAGEDDILIDQDLVLRRGEASRFGAGLVGSLINSMVRLYYFVRDEQRTLQAGPFVLHKGQVELVRFSEPLAPGGKLAIFARGADVNITSFGTLSTDSPFINRALDANQARALGEGFNLNGTGPAKVIAFYTPPAQIAAT
ncbi:MAG: hypothetical protein U0359_13905 [Byssovorax sp.]